MPCTRSGLIRIELVQSLHSGRTPDKAGQRSPSSIAQSRPTGNAIRTNSRVSGRRGAKGL